MPKTAFKPVLENLDSLVLLAAPIVPPVVAAGINESIALGATFTRAGSFTDPNACPYAGWVSYGDQTPTQTLPLNSDKTFSLSHVYATPGFYTVQVEIVDSLHAQGYGAFAVTVTDPLDPTAPVFKPGVDYLISGASWANPRQITYSFVPDGTQWDHGATNLFATFDAKFGAGVWEREIQRALNTWSIFANVKFVQVGDNGAAWNVPGPAQGDPRFGDIRFAGYPFLPGDELTLARTYFPASGITGGGDDEINTSQAFGIGTDYDLYSVMLHETGLALGLSEVSNPTEVMNGVYHGIVVGPQPGDIYGIQKIYGAPVPGGPAPPGAQPTGPLAPPPYTPSQPPAKAAAKFHWVHKRINHHWRWVRVPVRPAQVKVRP